MTNIQLPPYTGDADQDNWQLQVTEQLNAPLSALRVDGSGQVVSGDNGLGYTERYLDTAYGTDSVGSNFSQTPAGLPNNSSEIWQGVRNTDTITASTNPVEFTWRLVSSPAASQNTLAYYRIVGGRQIDWGFDSEVPASYDTDTGPPIDLDDFSGATGAIGPIGPRGADGAVGQGVFVVYADDTDGNDPSFVRNTRNFAIFYEADSEPALTNPFLPATYTYAALENVTYYQATIYRRSLTAPTTPTGGSFNFDTGTLTPPTGWSTFAPSGEGSIYSSTGLFSVVGGGTDSTVTWSTPNLLNEDIGNLHTIYRFHANAVTNDPGPPTGATGTGNGWTLPRDTDETNPHWEAVTTVQTTGREYRAVDFNLSGTTGDIDTEYRDTEQLHTFTVTGTPGQEMETAPARPEIDEFTFTGITADAVAATSSSVLTVIHNEATDSEGSPSNMEKFFLYPQGTSATSSHGNYDLYLTGTSSGSGTYTYPTTIGYGTSPGIGMTLNDTQVLTVNSNTPSLITGFEVNRLRLTIIDGQETAIMGFVGSESATVIRRGDYVPFTLSFSDGTDSFTLSNFLNVATRLIGTTRVVEFNLDTESVMTVNGTISNGDTGFTFTLSRVSTTAIRIQESNRSIDQSYTLDTDLSTDSELRDSLFNLVSVDTDVTDHYTVSKQTNTDGPVVRFVPNNFTGSSFTTTISSGSSVTDSEIYVAPSSPSLMRVVISTESIDTDFYLGSNLTGTALFEDVYNQVRQQASITNQFTIDTEQYDADNDDTDEKVITMTANDTDNHTLSVTITGGNLSGFLDGTITEGSPGSGSVPTMLRFDFQDGPTDTERSIQTMTLSRSSGSTQIYRNIRDRFNIPNIVLTYDSDADSFLTKNTGDDTDGSGDFIRLSTNFGTGSGTQYHPEDTDLIPFQNQFNIRVGSDTDSSSFIGPGSWRSVEGRWLRVRTTDDSTDIPGVDGYRRGTRFRNFATTKLAEGNLYVAIAAGVTVPQPSDLAIFKVNDMREIRDYGDGSHDLALELSGLTTFLGTFDIPERGNQLYLLNTPVRNNRLAVRPTTSNDSESSIINGADHITFTYVEDGVVDSDATVSVIQTQSGFLDSDGIFLVNERRGGVTTATGRRSAITTAFAGEEYVYIPTIDTDSDQVAAEFTSYVNSNFGTSFTATNQGSGVVRVTTDTDTDLSLVVSGSSGTNRSGVSGTPSFSLSSSKIQEGYPVRQTVGSDGSISVVVNGTALSTINVAGLTPNQIADRIVTAYAGTSAYTATDSDNVVTVVTPDTDSDSTTSIVVSPGRDSSNNTATLAIAQNTVRDGWMRYLLSGQLGTYTLAVGGTTYPAVTIPQQSSLSSIVDQIVSSSNPLTNLYDFTRTDSDTVRATSTFFNSTPDVTLTIAPGLDTDDSEATLAVAKVVDSEGSTGEPDLSSAIWEYFVISREERVDTDVLRQDADGTITVNRGLILNSQAYNNVGASYVANLGTYTTGARNPHLVFSGSAGVVGTMDTDTDSNSVFSVVLQASTDGGANYVTLNVSASFNFTSLSASGVHGQIVAPSLPISISVDGAANTTYTLRAVLITTKTPIPTNVQSAFTFNGILLEELRE